MIIKRPKITSIEKQAILSLGAIRYVPISSTEGFFVFKYPGTVLLYDQNLGEKCDGRDTQIWDASIFISIQHQRNACYILHNNKLIYRESNHAIIPKEKLIQAGLGNAMETLIKHRELKDISPTHVEALVNESEFDYTLLPDDENDTFSIILEEAPRGEVDDNYVSKYGDKISNAPEFQLDSMFTAEMKIQDLSGTPGKTCLEKEVDYLIPRPEVKPPTFSEWKHVRKLLIRFGLLREKRGKEKSIDPITIKLRAFILRELKSIRKKKPLPLKELRNRLIDKVNKLFPDDEKKAEKYTMSESTIRRLIESSMKK